MGKIRNPEADNKAFYDSIANDYIDFYHPVSRYQLYTQNMIKRFICENIIEGGRNLEIGHGPGIYTDRIAEKSNTLLAVDFSPKMQESCKQLVSRENITFLLSDVRDLYEMDLGEFDSIILIAVMPHIKDMDNVLGALKELLTKDGILIFDLWNRNSHACHGLNKWIKDVTEGRRPGRSDWLNVYTNFLDHEEMDDLIHKVGLQIVDEKNWHLVAFQRFPKADLLYPLYLIIEYWCSLLFKKYCYSRVFACKSLQ